MIGAGDLIQHFHIVPGVTALIGGGGKTSLLLWLAGVLQARGSVLVCTSTHILVPEHLPLSDRIDTSLPPGACAAIGTRADGGKLTAPAQPFSELSELADYVLCEADGSKHLPLKAHDRHEPVIPPESKAVLAVLGLDGIGQPIRNAAHRPALYAERLGVSEDAAVSPAMAAAVLRGYRGTTGYILNKADSPVRLAYAREIASQLPKSAAITVLQPKAAILELWRNGTCWLS